MANSRENKVSEVLRALLSFALFIMLVLASLSVCTKVVFLNKSSIENRFDSYEYVSAVKSSMTEYASDIYLKNGLDAKGLDEIFDYELIRASVKAYVSNNIGSAAGYNESTYLEPIDSICKILQSDITKQVKEKDLQYNSESVDSIVSSVKSYMINEIDIGFSDAKNIINIGSIASVAVLCVSLFFAAALALILFFIGTVRYRSIRAVSISFYTAGLFEIMISLTACIIFKIKHIDIFPLYLRELVMNYIYGCIGAVAVTGLLMIIAALIISVAVWKVKRERQQR